MVRYKRNQIEEAIARVLEPRVAEHHSELWGRLKRLLEADRALGQDARCGDPERANYAFYSGDAPGSGVEVWFSEYEAFALLNALRLTEHGWPQGFAVSIMRQVRPELAKHHTRILKQDPGVLFDQDAIRRNAKEGDMAFDNIDPVLLTIISKSGGSQSQAHRCAVCRGPDAAMKFAWDATSGAGAWTMFEVVSVAHRLSKELARTNPRRRGRTG